MTRSFYKDANGCVIVVDLSSQPHQILLEISEMAEIIRESLDNKFLHDPIPIVVACNKADIHENAIKFTDEFV
jgi:signal recognition particle receptor subunit beta